MKKPAAALAKKPKAAESKVADIAELEHEYKSWSWSSAYVSMWDVATVRRAIVDHDMGRFADSSQLVHALRKDPRIYSAERQCVSTVLGLPLEALTAERAWEGKAVAGTMRDEVADGFGTWCPTAVQAWFLAWGNYLRVAIGQVVWSVEERRGGALRLVPRVVPVPMHAVSWNELERRYEWATTEGVIPIVPGTFKWIIYEPDGPCAWSLGMVRPLGLVWADRTYGIRDRSRRAEAHGQAAVVGEMPAGVSPNSDEGRAFQRVMQGIQRGRSGLVRPAGSKTDLLEGKTDVHKIFESIIKSCNADIECVWVGQTGTTEQGTGIGDGGNKVHDGVRYDLLESLVATLYGLKARGDRSASPGCLTLQLSQAYAVLNVGRVDVAPLVSRAVPDLEEDDRLDALTKRHESYQRVLTGYRTLSIPVDEEKLQEQFKLDVPLRDLTPEEVAAAEAAKVAKEAARVAAAAAKTDAPEDEPPAPPG